MKMNGIGERLLLLGCCMLFLFFIACDKEPAKKGDPVVENDHILNGGFEEWEGSGKEEEPCHWNSFMSAATSGLTAMGKAQQVKPSSEVRPGSAGNKSVCIYARSIIGVIANGTLTTGQIHMGSTSPGNANNYNITRSNNADFHQIVTTCPDSIRFWVKFKCEDANQLARMSATLHDSCDYRDPETASDAVHVVAKAYREFSTQQGEWVRLTVPFSYQNSGLSPKYMLITFTTNKDAGKGHATDSLLIDDVELIYSDAAKRSQAAWYINQSKVK